MFVTLFNTLIMNYSYEIHNLVKDLSTKEWETIHHILANYMKKENVDKCLFLAACLEFLPGGVGNDYVCFDYKTIFKFTVDEWIKLTSALGNVGKYHLIRFLQCNTDFTAECYNKIGLDATPPDVFEDYTDKKSGIKVMSCKQSSYRLKTYEKLGMTEEDIMALRSFNLKKV